MPGWSKTIRTYTKKSGVRLMERIADDEGIKEDMPAWCKTTGNELLSVEEEGGQYRIYVRKS